MATMCLPASPTSVLRMERTVENKDVERGVRARLGRIFSICPHRRNSTCERSYALTESLPTIATLRDSPNSCRPCPMDTRARIKEVPKSSPEVLFGLLYGSRAAGRPRSDSDWDVAIYIDNGLTARERFDLRRECIASLSGIEAIDVEVLNDAPPLLAHRALQGELLLMRDKSAYVRFFVRAMREAEDERYFRSIHARERQRRVQEERFGRP